MEQIYVEFRDLTLAMEYLNAAADIAETRGVKTAEVDFGYAISYQSMGNHTREADLYRKALGYYEKAFATITATGETELYDRIISNYLVLLYSMGKPMQNSAPHLEAYMQVPLEDNSDISRKYNLELCRGLTELQADILRRCVTSGKCERAFCPTSTSNCTWPFLTSRPPISKPE